MYVKTRSFSNFNKIFLANVTGNSTEITEDYLTTSKKPTSISSNKNITETVTDKSAETSNMEHKNTGQTTKETFPPKLPPPIFEKKIQKNLA
uniref:Uncharacterized protein n=1 Tax=Meloidogyne enterolobii TaxID=390850 RepID=A0A6V7VK30_MELEN|nr:unnamed protein product [Meloidogyne enterolobii]